MVSRRKSSEPGRGGCTGHREGTDGKYLGVGQRHNQMELAHEFITNGRSDREFNAAVIERMPKPMPVVAPSSPYIGMTDKETQRFSILRAINAMATNDRRHAGFERAVSDATSKQLGKQPQGVFIPMDVLTRDLTKGTATAGGHLVATELLAGSFIDLLRNQSMVIKLGATVMQGLVGNIAIPRQTSSSTAYWVAENVDLTESAPAFDQVAMDPNTVGGFVDISRKLLLQTTPHIEQLVVRDLAATISTEIDRVAINGSGSGAEPLGIIGTVGIGSVAGGTNGLAPTWSHIVALKTKWPSIMPMWLLAYLSNQKVRGKLKKTLKNAASGSDYIFGDMRLEDGFSTLNGIVVTYNVLSTLTKGSASGVCSAILFGNWADLLIGMWGALDVLHDPYTGGKAGTLRIRVMQDCDVAVRNAVSFSGMLDALTT